MKKSTVVTLSLLSIFPFLATVDCEATGFVWDPGISSYNTGLGWSSFHPLNKTVAAGAGLGTGEGYGTVAPNGIGIPGVTAYAGPAPDSLVSQGINERPGHYYFGFANTYPNTDQFGAYELNNTTIKSGTYLDLWFRRTTTDPINFIGMCSSTSDEDIEVGREVIGATEYMRIRTLTVDPVYSTQGEGDQNSIFGLYVNYGNYDAGNVGIDYHGALFSTQIHWWDIDVPAIPKDKLASINLSTQSGVEADLLAFIPHSYFSENGLDPDEVSGYVDEDELPLGQEGNDHWFDHYGSVERDLNLDGINETSGYYKIHNDQWSEHDLGVGDTLPVPEPSTTCLLLLGGITLWIRRHRYH